MYNFITAEVLKDSINPEGKRIVSFLCEYPLMIHAEIMTHRRFSRNAASSRAIPVAKMLQRVRENPVVPIFWGANQKGMQSFELLPPDAASRCEEIWLNMSEICVRGCEEMNTIGLHKQWANRPLFAWNTIKVIITATEWGNFFKQRCHEAAMPEFQQLAYLMLHHYRHSAPELLGWGDWHLPFSEGHYIQDFEAMHDKVRLAVCTARCARTSYDSHDGNFTVEKDEAVHKSLYTNHHWSPFEHCAQAWGESYPAPGLGADHLPLDYANFGRGWLPYRKQFADEEVPNPTYDEMGKILKGAPSWIKLPTLVTS